MSHKLVSIIMPVYNGEAYIRESLESVLNQTYREFELIVVDDGSADGTHLIVKEYPIVHYIHQDNRGVASARNLGIANAKGDYLAFIDADDLWEPSKLTKQIAYMDAHPDVAYTFTYHSLFLASHLEEYPKWIRPDYLNRELTAFIPSALIMTKRCYDIVGPFNETYQTSEDSEWFFRARDLNMKYAVIEESLLKKRVHDSNLSSDTLTSRKNLLTLTRNSLIRRKAFNVSVIIPVYNGQRYLEEAVNSVLKQSYAPYEVIIVDDGSTDDTRKIAEAFGDKIKYLEQENAGAAAARNHGVNQSTGNYLAFLDADDYWTENRLQDGIAHLMQSNPNEIIFGLIREFYSPETDESFRAKYLCTTEPRKGIHPGTMLIKKSIFMDIGMFSSKYVTGEFIEWYARAQEKNLPSHIIQETHLYRRIHPNNHGITKKSNADDYAKIIRDMLMRKRESKNESK